MQNLKLKIKNFNHSLLFILYLLFAPIFLNGCATIYNPATQQKELILIDTTTEIMLGRQIDFQISQNYEFTRGTQENERVNIVGKRIAEVSDRQDLKYVFRVVKNKEVNAFCTPGGFVYVNTGLLEKVDDDELACVLGHEVGHIAARHMVKRLQAQMGYELLISLALGRGGAQEIEKALNIAFNIVALGYSRGDELLADKLGIKYAYKAGYDPEAMIRFFKKLQELKKDKSIATPLFLRSHPYLEQRIQQAEKEISALRGVSEEISFQPPVKETPEPKESTQSTVGPPKDTNSLSLFYGLYKKMP